MQNEWRIVVDTNVLISAALSPTGTSRQALLRAAREGILLVSSATLAEFIAQIHRPKFEQYLDPEERDAYVVWILARTERIHVTERVKVSRDPKDDMFIELALSGNADVIVTGDNDLLVLDPFRGIRIVTPAVFLQMELGN